MIEFKLKEDSGNYIALNQLLKATQFCESGAMANVFISDGLIQLNGEIEYRKRAKIKRGDIVCFEDKQIQVI